MSTWFRPKVQNHKFIAIFTISKINFSGYQIRVFTIALCYIVATMASFQAFTMLAPGAALGARCSSRTFFAILLSFFCLKEKILKFEIISVRWFSDTIIAYCTALGLLLHCWIALLRWRLNNEKHDCHWWVIIESIWKLVNNPFQRTGLPPNLMIGLGFGLCAIAGLSRSVGMTMYRKIKGKVFLYLKSIYKKTSEIKTMTSKLSHVINILVEIDPVTIVLVHSLMTVIAVIPIMRKNPQMRYYKNEFSWVWKLQLAKNNNQLDLLGWCLLFCNYCYV